VPLRNTGRTGLEQQPTGLRTGQNSGYQAINLAVHLGAAHLVLLGYDLQPGPGGEHHWHPPHPIHRRSSYQNFLRDFPTLVTPLDELGITVVNATRRTALDCWPRVPLEDALAAPACEAAS